MTSQLLKFKCSCIHNKGSALFFAQKYSSKKRKMSIGLSEGFIKADSTNLPRVDMFMVRDLLILDERFNAPEVRGVKMSQ